MTEDDFRRRTEAFAVSILKFLEVLPRSVIGSVIVRQLAKSGTSIGANYRAACRDKSTADMIFKL